VHRHLSPRLAERITPRRDGGRHVRAIRASGNSVPNPTPAIDLPWLLTPDEAGSLLRTSRKGIYAMIERRLLPGVTRIGRRVLIRRDDLVDWLGHKSAPSLKE